MRALPAALLLATAVLPAWAALPAWAQSPLVAELRVWSTRYNENPTKIDELRVALEKVAQKDADLDTLLALSEVCFMYCDVRAKTPDEKLEAYDRGSQVAKRAIELAPKSAPARFWYGTNTGRWGQTKGVMRSLFLLPTVKGAMEAAIDLDPAYAPAYALGGSIYYEVPGFVGGDLDRSEALFRKGLELDPHYTNMRIGLARTLSKKGKTAEARREAMAVLDEKAPSNPADWIVKDVPQAKALLGQIKERP
jgi:tetratricopeptide (TPR) repeat protein